MRPGILRRLGLILVAVAFLGGGIAGFAVPIAFASPAVAAHAHAATTAGQDMAGLCCAPHSGHDQMPSGPTKHAHDCLATCAATCALLADPRPLASVFVWTGTPLRHASPLTSSPRGVTHEPPLFPPIAA